MPILIRSGIYKKHILPVALARVMELAAQQLPSPSSAEIWRAIRTATRPVIEMVIK